MIHKVADVKDFKKQLKDAGDKLVVVDFFATWGGPYCLIAPLLEQISEQNKNLVMLKVNVDENEELIADYGVSSMPTFVFIKRGEKVDSFSGASEAMLCETITKYSQSATLTNQCRLTHPKFNNNIH